MLPITPAEFAAVFRRLAVPHNPAARIALRLAANPESVLLLHLVRQTVDPKKIVAFTPNPEGLGNDDLRKVVRFLADSGVEHRITDSTPPGRPPDASGGGRMPGGEAAADNLDIPSLAQQARAASARFVVLPTTLTEQAENVVYRLARHSGIDGLGGYRDAEDVVLDRLGETRMKVMRPLLGFSKARVVATCEEAGLPQIPDRNGAHASEVALPEEEIQAFATRMQVHAAKIREKTLATVKKHTRQDTRTGASAIFLNVDPDSHSDHWFADPVVALRVLRELVLYSSALQTKPHLAALRKLHGHILDQLARPPAMRTNVTVGGTMFAPHPRSDLWFALRQPPSRTELPQLSVPVRFGDLTMWDNRFLVQIRKAPGGFGGDVKGGLSFLIRPAELEDYRAIQRKLRGRKDPKQTDFAQLRAMTQVLVHLPQHARNLVPAVVLVIDGKAANRASRRRS
ncbi:hypothetical protein DFJ74DRAFT_771779 [Hyaloraphidium curvatum]|nr:hypothetical protein DFJ74DRAFT_771779 [Hyaloraphidium curvatum]